MNYPKQNDVTELIVCLAKLYKPRRYLEIGTQRGYTFCKVAPLVEEAHAVDPVIQRAVRAVPNAVLHECTSDEYFESLNYYAEFDMIFVDGVHTQEQVFNDVFHAYVRVVVGTGLVLVHDTFPITRRLERSDRCGSAWKGVDEFRESFCCMSAEVLTLPGPYYGLSIIRRRSPSDHFGFEREER
jgi:predicted O-methyltransferase YrrM